MNKKDNSVPDLSDCAIIKFESGVRVFLPDNPNYRMISSEKNPLLESDATVLPGGEDYVVFFKSRVVLMEKDGEVVSAEEELAQTIINTIEQKMEEKK